MFSKDQMVVLRNLPPINKDREGDVCKVVGELETRFYHGWVQDPKKPDRISSGYEPTYTVVSEKGWLTVHALCVYPLEGEHHVERSE